MNCLGSGAIKKIDCEFCNGNGVTIKIHRMGPFIQQIKEKCQYWNIQASLKKSWLSLQMEIKIKTSFCYTRFLS